MENQVEVVPESQLVVVVRESGLDQVKSATVLEKFKDYKKIAEEWEAKAKTIVVTDVNQLADMKMARVGRLELRQKRIAIENTRKELKEQSLREGKAIDAVAKFLESLIVPIEKYLGEQEDFIKIKEAEAAEVKRLEDEKILEEHRLKKEKEAAEEQQRIKLENERLKLEAEEKEKERLAEKKRADDELAAKEAEIKKQKDEAAAAQKQKEDELKAQQEEADRKQREADAAAKAEQQRIQKEADEKIAAEKKNADDEAARVKAEADKKLSEERAERERVEKELKDKQDAEAKSIADEKARIEALAKASDKEKVAKVWLDFNAIEYPDVESEDAKIAFETVKGLVKQIQSVLDVVVENAK